MTTNIKKNFQPIVHLLEKNKNKKVSAILAEVIALTEAKVQASTSHIDENGNVIAVYCYFHKQWELVENVPYGKKASSTTGLNTMCKAGVSAWTKQQRAIKQVGTKLINMLEAGEIQLEDMADKKAELTNEAMKVEDEAPTGYATLEEALEAHKAS